MSTARTMAFPGSPFFAGGKVTRFWQCRPGAKIEKAVLRAFGRVTVGFKKVMQESAQPRSFGILVDVLTPQQRSYNMSRIRGRNTKPEISLRKALWSAGFRYRIKNKLPGHPDLIFPHWKVAVFVDGCFWHACPDHSTSPVSNAEFWRRKIEMNVARDRKSNQRLRELGWIVVRVWEHEIRDELDEIVKRIAKHLSVSKFTSL